VDFRTYSAGCTKKVKDMICILRVVTDVHLSGHRRRSGWTSWGGRMASAEGGSVSSGVAYGEACPLSNRLRGLGER